MYRKTIGWPLLVFSDKYPPRFIRSSYTDAPPMGPYRDPITKAPGPPFASWFWVAPSFVARSQSDDPERGKRSATSRARPGIRRS